MKDNEWIDVSKKKPNQKEHVLLYIEDTEGLAGQLWESKNWLIAEGSYFWGKFFVHNSPDAGVEIGEGFVKAWKPLPKPYRKDSK